MAKAPVNEVLSTLKSYARKLSDGERTPAEIASALNDWAHESGQTLKAKISEEVEAAVLKMGFVKREEVEALVREVNALKKGKKSPVKKSATKKAPVKKSAAKKATKPVKKSTKRGL
jgi:GTPase involved in cell partitioning and DNA repair